MGLLPLLLLLLLLLAADKTRYITLYKWVELDGDRFIPTTYRSKLYEITTVVFSTASASSGRDWAVFDAPALAKPECANLLVLIVVLLIFVDFCFGLHPKKLPRHGRSKQGDVGCTRHTVVIPGSTRFWSVFPILPY